MALYDKVKEEIKNLENRGILRDGPFDIRGGGGLGFFEKNSFPLGAKKNKISSKKLKIKSLFFIQ